MQIAKISNFKQENGIHEHGAGPPSDKEAALPEKGHTGVVSVEFETREGSAKIDKDFKYLQGTLVS